MISHVCDHCKGNGLEMKRRRAVIAYVTRYPRAKQTEVADALLMCRQTAHEHIHAAQRDGCLPAKAWRKGGEFLRGRFCGLVLPDWTPPPSWPIGAVP